MVSIVDVARHAGVSTTTVSHAISGKRQVSDTVRQKVEMAMDALEYVPTRAAQSLALGKTNVLALVVPDISIEYFAELAQRVESVAMDFGYSMILATTGFDAKREGRYLEMIAGRAVDGVIYTSGAKVSEHAKKALTRRLPVVLVDEEISGLDLTTIVSDNEAGGRIVAEHLASLGHRNVLEIQGQGAPITSIRRSKGFANVWKPLVGEVTEVAGNYSAASGKAIVEARKNEFLERHITAIFAHNDLMALGAIEGLNAFGVSVPRDVSVVGFDDISAGRYSSPGLTTVRQDVQALGTVAAQKLLHAIDTGEALQNERLVFPVELVLRASTGEVK